MTTENFEVRKFLFIEEEKPTEEELKMISSNLEDIVFDDYIVLSTYRRLSGTNEVGFSLTKNESASWSGIHSALQTFFDQKFPGSKILSI